MVAMIFHASEKIFKLDTSITPDTLPQIWPSI